MKIFGSDFKALLLSLFGNLCKKFVNEKIVKVKKLFSRYVE